MVHAGDGAHASLGDVVLPSHARWLVPFISSHLELLICLLALGLAVNYLLIFLLGLVYFGVAQIVIGTGAGSRLGVLQFVLIVLMLRLVLLLAYWAVLLRKIFCVRFDKLAAGPLQSASHLMRLLILLVR